MANDIIRGRLINAYYTSHDDTFTLKFVVLTLVDGKPVKITIPWRPSFDPYFYCTGEAIQFLKECFAEIKEQPTITNHNEVTLFGLDDTIPYKVRVSSPDKIGQVKQLSKWKNNPEINDKYLFEGDIHYILRCLIDLDLTLGLEFDFINYTITNVELGYEYDPRILFYDLEVIKGEIVSISYGNNDGIIRHYCAKEKEIIKSMQILMKEFDYFISWSDYEEKTLKKRTKALKIKVDWHLMCFVDQMFITTSTHPKFAGRNYLSLDEFGERTCELKKLKMPKGLGWYYYNDRDRFEAYNNRDVEIQIKGERATGSVAGWIEAIHHCNIPLDYARYVSIIPKVLWLKEVKNLPKRIILPSGKYIYEVSPFRGASVTQDPPYGVFKNVFAMDLLGSYSGIIRTYFPHLKRLLGVNDSIADALGLFPVLIEKAIDHRNVFKDLRNQEHKDSGLYKKYQSQQYGQKVISLVFYGELGRAKSPFYVRECAQGITDWGREHIHRAEDKLDVNFPAKRLYRDTDSIYWEFLFDMNWNESSVKTMMNNVLTDINKDFDFMLDIRGIPNDHRYVRMEAQAFYDNVLWAGIAKCYMGEERYSADTDEWHDYPKLFIKGWVKLGAGKLALDVQHLVGRLLIDGVTFDEIIGYLRCIKDDIMRGKYNEGLIQKTGMSMKLKEYKSRTFVWYAAERAKNEGKYTERTSFEWVITKVDNKQVTAEMVHEGVIPKIQPSGYLYMFNNYVLSKAIAPLKSIEKNEIIIKSSIIKSNKSNSVLLG